jgi:hypothetical protein
MARPPDGVTPSSKRLWRQIDSEYVLSAAELELLHQALVSLDRANAAAEQIDADGLTVADRFGAQKPHPLIDVEARHRTVFARLIAQLNVKAVAPTQRRLGAPGGRRPAYPSLRGVS